MKIKNIFKIIIITLLFFLSLFLFNEFFLYKELGQLIALYKSKECVNINIPVYVGLEDCYIYTNAVGDNLLVPKNLNNALNEMINIIPKRDSEYESIKNILKNFPKNPSEWICATNGKIVQNNDQEKILGKQYKCWPK